MVKKTFILKKRFVVDWLWYHLIYLKTLSDTVNNIMDISKIESRIIWAGKIDVENMECEAIKNSVEFSFISFFFVLLVCLFFPSQLVTSVPHFQVKPLEQYFGAIAIT